MNQKYKTSLCRHWQASGTCSMGVRCLFAHGQAELRNPADPIPIASNVMGTSTSFINPAISDTAAMSAMVAAQQYELAYKQHQQLKNAAKNGANQMDVEIATIATGGIESQAFDVAADPAVQKKITLAQLRLIVKEMLKMTFVHPVIMCKIRICNQLIEVDNIESCTVVMNDIMERPSMGPQERAEYDKIIQLAGQLAIQMMAEEKVRLQRIQKEHQMILNRQQSVISPPLPGNIVVPPPPSPPKPA